MNINKGESVFFICNDPERALGLEDVLDNFHIVCIDDNQIIDYMLARGLKVFSLEREIGKLNPIFRNSNKLLQQEIVQKYISDNSEGPPNVIFFKIAPNIERTCQGLGYNILNTTSDLNRKFELKISQFEALKDSNVNFPATKICILGECEYEDLITELGESIVLQYDRGHTGTSTIFIQNKVQLDAEKEKFPKRMVRISKKIEGDAWTINACVTRFGIAYGGLSYQITGIPEITSQPGGTVGNDWTLSCRLESESINQIEDITNAVGEKMRASGFKGLFGLDFVVDEEGKVFLIEVNARQPASTGMHTKLMLSAGIIPLQAFHIAEFLFDNEGDYLDFLRRISPDFPMNNFVEYLNEQNKEAIKPIHASQIIARNTSNKDAFIDGDFKPGIYVYGSDSLRDAVGKKKGEHLITYSLDDDGGKKLFQLRSGYSIRDVRSDEGFVVLAIGSGHEVSSGNEIFRIQAPFSLLDMQGKLRPWVRNVILGLKKYLL